MNYRQWMAGLLATALAATALLAGCRSTANPAGGETTSPAGQAQAVTPEPGTLSLAAAVLAQPDLSTLGSALIASGLAPELETGAAYTLLAPTDAAFEALPDGLLDRLFDDPALLADLVRYHLILGATSATDLAQLGTATTLQGEAVTVTLSSAVDVTIDGAQVVEADIAASNGVIHKIDQVLLPSTVQAFAAAAPTPTAIASSPLTATETTTGTSAGAVLLPTLTPTPGAVTGTGVITTDVITPTDAVTSAEGVTSAAPISPVAVVTTLVTVTTTSRPDQTIAEVLAARPDLSATATAVATAGLAEALAEPGPFTFFAPTNAAFERVDPAELDALLNDNVRLARTMQYHVVADRVTVNDLARLGAALSTLGQSMTVTVAADGRLLVNGAPVLESIETANGIMHVLDGILIPAAE